MRLTSVLLFALPYLILPTLLHADKLPLCGDNCNCLFINNTELAKVTCVKDVKTLVTNVSTWINPENSQPYPYLRVTLTNQNFIELNFTFPKSELTYLNLANNDIYGIRDSVFQNLQSLKVLILSYNDLELLSPDAFKGQYLAERFEPLKSLVELRLDHNRLHTLNMNIFEHTTDLEILDLSHNPLKVIDKHTTIAIDSLTMLKELYLGYTQITTLPDLILHTPKYISVLDLSGNPIDRVPEALQDSHNLTTLYLNDTAFVNLTKLNGFPDLPSVKILHICHMQNLERIEQGALSGLTGLDEVHISDNIMLTFLDAFALAKIGQNGGTIWPLLRKLHLGNNKLAYLDSDFVARWDSLTALDIRANPWTCECENQWMVEDLMPIYMKIDSEKASQVRCAAPVEMVDYTFLELYERKYKMRCLDVYGAEPEKDAVLLVGILAAKTFDNLLMRDFNAKVGRGVVENTVGQFGLGVRNDRGDHLVQFCQEMGSVLISIPLILFGIYSYQRRWFGLFTMCDDSPAAYSRRYYSTTSKEDDF